MASNLQTRMDAVYIVGAILLWAVLYFMLTTILEIFGVHVEYVVSLLGTLVIAAGVILLARRDERVNVFGTEVITEATKVTWPNRKETIGSTGVVLVTVFVIAFFLATVDVVLLWIVERIFP